MRRTKGLFATLCLALTLCLVLVGCGGASGANTAEANKNFVATWSIESMTSNGAAMSDNELAVIKAMGFYLTLEEGGKASLEMLGTLFGGTWEVKDATTATLKLSNASLDDIDLSGQQEMKVADGKLTMAQDNSSMVFVQIDPSQKGATNVDSLIGTLDNASSVTSDLSTQLSEPVALDAVIADDEVCTITVVSKGDYFGDPAFLLSVTNHTDIDIHVDDNNEFDINGVVASPIFEMKLAPEETKTEMLWFENSTINNGGVESLEGVAGQIVVTNAASKEELGRYDFVM